MSPASTLVSSFRLRQLDWKDVVCVLVLAIAGLTLRLPSLDRVALNPDESQYEAIAAYMVATGLSAFEVPHSTGGSFALYGLMARLFGPYSMFEMRLLVLAIVFCMSLLLYVMLRRETSRWAGLAAGLVFVHYNLYFEGLTANREWFAAPLLLAGGLCYALWDREPERRGLSLVFVAGLLSSLALWFKLQAVPMVFAIPAVVLWRLWAGDDRARSLRALASYGVGAALGLAGYFAAFLAVGTLSDYVASIVTDWSDYTMGGGVPVEAAGGSGPTLYLARLYLALPFRTLILVAYAVTVVCLALMTLRATGRRTAPPGAVERRSTLLFVGYFLSGLVTVSLGRRFFDHYYLFLVFSVAALVGIALHALATSPRDKPGVRNVAIALVLLFVADRTFVLADYTPSRIAALWPESVIVVLYVAGMAALLLFALLRPQRRMPWTLAALIWLEIGMLVTLAQLRETPSSLPHHRQGYPALTRYLQQQGRPGDRLFVWGWAPEIYSVTRMEPASHFVVAQWIVNDTVAVRSEPLLEPTLADELLRDLEARPAHYIVDAARRSWTMLASGDPWIYDLRHYPDFELVHLLEREYELVGTFDDCPVYARRPAGKAPG